MTVKIEKNIPVPKRAGHHKYSFDEYEIGDSAFYPEDRRKVQAYSMYYGKSQGKKFATRMVVENRVKGTRIWRTE